MVGATTRLYNKGFSASEVGPSLDLCPLKEEVEVYI
jgi:hypothetical protein